MVGNILIVDDDSDIRETFAEALRMVGYVVHTAANGKIALEMLADLSPCLILLDLMMPVMNGEEFRQQQLGSPTLSKIPVVVITADRDAQKKATKMGISEGLSKPIDFESLSDVARRYCGEAA